MTKVLNTKRKTEHKGVQSIQLNVSCASSYMIRRMHECLCDYYLPGVPMLPYVLFLEKYNIMNGLIKQK